jgi:hypothetical protein
LLEVTKSALQIRTIFLKSLIKSIVIGSIAYLSLNLKELNGLSVSLLTLSLMILLFPSISLKIAERHSKRLMVFSDIGLLKSLLSGLTLRVISAFILSLSSSVLLLIFMSEASISVWTIILACGVLSVVPNSLFKKTTEKEFKFPFSSLRNHYGSNKIASAVGTWICLIYLYLQQPTFDEIGTYKSHTLQELITFSSLLGVFDDQLIQVFFSAQSTFIWSIGCAILFIKYFFGILLVLTVSDIFTLPSNILMKSVSSIKFFDDPVNHSKYALLWAVCITIYFAMVIWIPSTARIEYSMTQRHVTNTIAPVVEKISKPISDKIVEIIEIIDVSVEMINGKYYKPGTIDQLTSLETALTTDYDDTNFKTQARREINRSFGVIEGNVDIFLDHYYSLEAEYVRIAKMFTGELDEYLKDELTSALKTGDPLNRMNRIIAEENEVRAAFKQEKDALIDELKSLLETNELVLQENERPKVLSEIQSELDSITLSELLNAKEQATPIRWGASASTGVIVGLVVKKVVAKGTLKTLGVAIAKVAAKKAGGAATGGLVGGVLGSIVPGIGTVVVGAIGTVFGTIAVDWGALQLDEMISREPFKAEIAAEVLNQRDLILERLK